MAEIKYFEKRILQALLDQNLIKEQDNSFLESEKTNTDKSLVEMILERQIVDPKTLLLMLAEIYESTPVNPNAFKISEDVLQLIPSTFATERKVIPISLHESVLTVAMENPTDLMTVDDLKAITGMRIKTSVALPNEMKIAYQRMYGHMEPEAEEKPQETMEELVRIVQEAKNQETEVKTMDLLRQAQETPIIKVANALMLDAIKRKASDLFIEPWEKSMRVRCRVDGILEEVKSPPKSMGAALVSRFKVMSQLDIAERRVPQDGRFKVKIQNREVDIRVSILPSCFGEKICLRVLDKKAQAHGLDKLGFSEKELEQMKACVDKPHGMILVTGPTGSGKTTTLYSILKHLDAPDKNITTVEDPVEYQVNGINQVNVRDAIGLTFPSALRSILRQDPDIILIGEIRDLTTMDIAIKSALTGHLVLSTLHTNDTVGSIVRIVNMGIEPFLITSSVLMISAQRLIRRLCKSCREPITVDQELAKRLNLAEAPNAPIYKPAGSGCPKCRHTGYAGRTVITEILVLTPEIKELILKSASGEEIKRLARKQSMTTLRESGIQRVLEGETSLDEVFRVTVGDQQLEI